MFQLYSLFGKPFERNKIKRRKGSIESVIYQTNLKTFKENEIQNFSEVQNQE